MREGAEGGIGGGHGRIGGGGAIGGPWRGCTGLIYRRFGERAEGGMVRYGLCACVRIGIGIGPRARQSE